MRIQSIELVTAPALAAPPHGDRPSWHQHAEVANPVSHFPHAKALRRSWQPGWDEIYVIVTDADGAWGVGSTSHGGAVEPIIRDHLAPQLVGHDADGIDRLWDLMSRMVMFYGPGLARLAVSAIDLALWDLKGRRLNEPVYRLLGGDIAEPLQCYTTGNDVDWHRELGFNQHKLALPYGPADGNQGIRDNVRFVAAAREQARDDADLMVDCWMALDVAWMVRMSDALRDHEISWYEEALPPGQLGAHAELRERMPRERLAGGEHWTTVEEFAWAANHRVLDVFQPDVNWCGGISAIRRIAAIAGANGIEVILHAGGRNVFGQHASAGVAEIRRLEQFIFAAPGVRLDDWPVPPGQPVPNEGTLVPNETPGFGLEWERDDWLPWPAA